MILFGFFGFMARNGSPPKTVVLEILMFAGWLKLLKKVMMKRKRNVFFIFIFLFDSDEERKFKIYQ
jgi:hypothetical protein